LISIFFFFNDSATTDIYTLSLHDALPIYVRSVGNHPELQSWLSKADALGESYQFDDLKDDFNFENSPLQVAVGKIRDGNALVSRSEEHTSELQSRGHLVCRLLLEKKKTIE